jgi:hypothetical protein
MRLGRAAALLEDPPVGRCKIWFRYSLFFSPNLLMYGPTYIDLFSLYNTKICNFPMNLGKNVCQNFFCLSFEHRTNSS